MRIVTLFLLLLLYGLPTVAQTAHSGRSFWDGHTLREKCGKFDYAEKHPRESVDITDLLDASQCRGYVAAMADQLEMDNVIRMPQGVSDVDAVKIINLYVERHPEQLYLSAQAVAGLALHEKFPASPEKNQFPPSAMPGLHPFQLEVAPLMTGTMSIHADDALALRLPNNDVALGSAYERNGC